jgi:osmoprotectant transport system substrate-binding protein
MGGKKIRGLTIALALLLTACVPSKKPLIVGSKNFTEQVVLGELIAQHLEHRLGRPVQRQLNLGGTLLTYQALLNGQISLYPEYTGTIEAEILRETPTADAAQVYERSRLEMERRSQLDLLPSLGFDNTFVMVISGEAARKNQIATLSEAAQAKQGWKLGMGYEFSQRIDGEPALNTYHLPMAAAPRSMDMGLVYKALADGQVTMIAANATDGPLAAHDWTTLRDDKKAFGSYQACVLVRDDIEAGEPRLKPALLELSGKVSSDAMRKMNAAVDVDHRRPADVAADFLAKAGLQ